jgi:solute carrier family 25 phosphate transporter 3
VLSTLDSVLSSSSSKLTEESFFVIIDHLRVPYTMTKFVAYEKVAEFAYNNLIDKSTASSSMVTVVNLGSGLMAGFAAAIVSQPADTMLSKINKTKGLPGEGTMSRLVKIAGELGLRGSFSGLGARLFMVGTLVS